MRSKGDVYNRVDAIARAPHIPHIMYKKTSKYSMPNKVSTYFLCHFLLFFWFPIYSYFQHFYFFQQNFPLFFQFFALAMFCHVRCLLIFHKNKSRKNKKWNNENIFIKIKVLKNAWCHFYVLNICQKIVRGN